jgi:hypothetical protein
VYDRILEAICDYADRRGARQAEKVRQQRAYERALRQNAARERWIEAGRRRD